MTSKSTVFIVDDDESLRDALLWLLESVGLSAKTFSSATDFLGTIDPSHPGCCVFDVRMPDMSGLTLQKQLRDSNIEIPIIFVTGHADVPMCVQAFQNGAFSFFEKPVNHQELLDDVHRAIKHDLRRRDHEMENLSPRVDILSPREREVMELIVAGITVKRIANQLGISIQTCSKHRARVLDKMGVGNDVELVRLVLANPASKANCD